MHQFTIVHFSQDFARGKAQLGAYGRIFNICSDKNTHIIFTLSPKIKTTEEYNIGLIRVIEIPVERTPLSKKQQFLIFRKIALEIKEYLLSNEIKPDLLFSHSQIFNFYVLRELKRKFLPEIKILWEANAVWGITPMGSWKGRISNRLNWWFQRNIYQQADGIVCHTNSSRDFIVKNFGVEASKCDVIANAVLPKAGQGAPEVKLNNPKKLLCLGLFDEMNGIPFLVDFIRKGKGGSSVEFHFIGDGLYRPLVEKLHAEGLCKYWGRLPHSEMQRKYQEFDFVIIPRLPCIEAELFIPTKLIESMFAGVIPICSDVSGMSEVVEHGENGFLFKAGSESGLKEILSEIEGLDETSTRRIANNAYATILKNYNWKNKHEDLNLIYQRLTQNNP